jgi:very-short-patch-repair endonuclease
MWHMRSHDVGFFEEHSSRIREGLRNQPPRKRNSKAELAFMSKMIEVHGEGVIHKHRVDGIDHEFDFYVPSENILVEFDGDYWHGNPERYELTSRMKRQFRIDESFTRAAEKLGYVVKRVWESEALNYPFKLRTI